MAKWDAERRVLNHEHTRFWRYTLQDVTVPNLQRAVFPDDEVCRIDFDHKIIPISPASDRFITDTTFRAGQQARPPFTVQQIVDLFDLLHRVSGPYGVVRQTEFFLYSDRDRLCDTMGYGVTYPGAALPRAVDKLVRAMIDDAGVPGGLLEWHGHNDFHKVLVNAAWAWLYGCAAVNGAILGFGERTGNTPLEGLIIEYIGLRGDSQGVDTTVIADIAEYVKREMGVTLPPNYPLVGIDFNATGAGIHIDGVIKNEEIYNIFDTEKILNRPMTVVITDKSDLAGIAHRVNTHLMLTGEQRVDKRHPGIAKIYKWVMDQYAAGRVTSISHGEIERQARRHLPEYFVSDFDRIKWQAREMAAHLLEKTIETLQLKSMRPKLIEPLLKKLVAEHPFIQFAYATDMEGRKVTKNITQAVDKAKYEKVGLHEDYSDRTWFIEPLKGGQAHVSELYTSQMTGRPCLTVSGPIRDLRDQIIGVCGLDIKFEDLAKAEKKETLKPGAKG